MDQAVRQDGHQPLGPSGGEMTVLLRAQVGALQRKVRQRMADGHREKQRDRPLLDKLAHGSFWVQKLTNAPFS